MPGVCSGNLFEIAHWGGGGGGVGGGDEESVWPPGAHKGVLLLSRGKITVRHERRDGKGIEGALRRSAPGASAAGQEKHHKQASKISQGLPARAKTLVDL